VPEKQSIAACPKRILVITRMNIIQQAVSGMGAATQIAVEAASVR